jgi:hypothetical protein
MKRPSGTHEALDVAEYVSDVAAQIEAMALAAGLELLAYFLGMARSEADLFVRTNSGRPEGDPHNPQRGDIPDGASGN